jgi:hypothetical protein
MLAAYKVCDQYSDEGVVDGPLGRHWFTTQFERPDRLSFSFGGWLADARVAEYRLESLGAHATVWRARDQAPEPYESLALAVAALTGVTSGVSHCVPALLMPELGGRTLAHLAHLRLVGSDIVDSVHCHVVEGVYPGVADCVEQLWIARDVPFLARVAMQIRAEGLGGRFVCEYLARGV